MNSEVPRYGEMAFPKGYKSFINTIGPLACDMYALTMTYGAWKLGFAEEKQTASNVFCRSLLDNGETYAESTSGKIKKVQIPFLINAGLGPVGEFLDGWQWKIEDLIYLASLHIDDGKGNKIRTFPDDFLFWLSKQKMSLTINAIPEGALILPHEPSMQISGLFWQQMMVEAMCLNLISSSTNLATVATQMRYAAQRHAARAGAQLIEMSANRDDWAVLADNSLRRSPSIAALQSSRGSYIGGWDSTATVYAGKCYGIPVTGTFAHAWVMLHDTEEEAFENWAKAFPGSTVFLADTYNTIEAVKTVIKICQKHGIRLKGIRLDSGDLDDLSCQTHALLAEAGFRDTLIIASNRVSVSAADSLFGSVASDITQRSSYINAFGVGSTISVNEHNPLLDFVMKLCVQYNDRSANRDELAKQFHVVRDLMKVGDGLAKASIPGLTDVLRFSDGNGLWAGDAIIPSDLVVDEHNTGRLSRDLYCQPFQQGDDLLFPRDLRYRRMLTEWMRNGEMLQKDYIDRDARAILSTSRRTAAAAMETIPAEHRRLRMPKLVEWGMARELAHKQSDTRAKICASSSIADRRKRFGLEAA